MSAESPEKSKPQPAPAPAPKAPPRSSSPWDDDDEDKRGFMAQHWGKVTILIALAGGGIWFASKNVSNKPSAPQKAPELTMVKVNLPPPPPPPPPPPQPPEQKMVEQKQDEIVDKPPDEAPPDPSPAATTNNVGNGPPDGFGLRAGNGGGRIGGNNQNRKVSAFGLYAGQVQGLVANALRNNRRTRVANARIEVRIWADETGRISRAKLGSSTGDAALDTAIRDEVLTGLRLHQPPPQGMPMPIVMRLTARRP